MFKEWRIEKHKWISPLKEEHLASDSGWTLKSSPHSSVQTVMFHWDQKKKRKLIDLEMNIIVLISDFLLDDLSF